MRTRSESELKLKTSTQPIRTVEVDLNGLRDGAGPNPGIAAALARSLQRNPSLSATVYVRIGPSTNFHEYTWSAFIAPVGSADILEAIRATFAGQGVRARISDAVRQSECLVHMHVEDGTIWVPDEPGIWCGLEGTAHEAAATGDVDEDADTDADATDEDELLEDDEVLDHDIWLEEEEDNLLDAPKERTPRRQRAARNDASVGTIIRKIEKTFGLPQGSVALRGPDRKALRRDALIVTLRRRWEE